MRPIPSRPGPLALRLNPVERAELEAAADTAGVQLSTYIKQAALGKADSRAIVIAGPAAALLREQAALRGMAVDDFAVLILAQLVAPHALVTAAVYDAAVPLRCGVACPEEPDWTCSRVAGHGGRHEGGGGDWWD